MYLLTDEFGLVKARAQGIRNPGAKLAPALKTLSESDIILVRGKEAWRLSGAVASEDWYSRLPRHARARAGRIARLLLRLLQGETHDAPLYTTYRSFLDALTTLSDTEGEAAEYLVALRILGHLGLDTGGLTSVPDAYDEGALTFARDNRRDLIARVNRGIVASGL